MRQIINMGGKYPRFEKELLSMNHIYELISMIRKSAWRRPNFFCKILEEKVPKISSCVHVLCLAFKEF